MKKYISFLTLLLVMFGCADLDLKPQDSTTGNIVFKDINNMRSYLAKVYAAYILTGQDGPAGNPDLTLVPDEGFTSYIRAYWKAQQLTTDETKSRWTDAGIQDLNTHTWSSENQFVRVLYYRLFLIIAYSNDLLSQTTPDKLTSYGYTAEELQIANVYRAEARFLRAMAYWHALDLFRNVPLLTEIVSTPPAQATPEAVFSFIEEELIAIEDEMVDAKENEYGRADKGALWMLQAKLYLNSEVYLGIGQGKYTECITALDKLFAAGYSLEPNYRHLFGADNHLSNELIFTFPSDGLNSQGYGGTTFLVSAAIFPTLMTPADYGTNENWGGNKATSVFVDKFDDITGATDTRAIFFTTGMQKEIPDLLNVDGEYGYAVPKFTNLTRDGEAGSHPTFADTDYPVFRLADAYLMYAEAVLRGGNGGDAGTALDLINDLRERAYGNTDGNIVSGDLTLDFILDERSRELYWEGNRRVDLIRFGEYTNQGIWPWKGGVETGQVTSSHLNIFPIPASDLAANPNLDQNDDY